MTAKGEEEEEKEEDATRESSGGGRRTMYGEAAHDSRQGGALEAK